MILTRPTPWGIITGKLSTTPEQAKRMFGFEQDPDAKGIIIRRQKSKEGKFHLVVCNFKPKATFSPKQTKIRQVVAVLSNIVRQERNTLINSVIWRPNKPTRCPHNMFTAENISRIGSEQNWENMIITRGPLFPPTINKAYYDPERHMISIPGMEPDIGVGVFDTTTYKFFLFTPPNSEEIFVRELSSTPILHLYKKTDGKYSKSIPLIPEIKSIL
ncbi:MAG: hypothetical protein PHE49_09725 [bacterium]|nr:hypothetical protein [bacterium]